MRLLVLIAVLIATTEISADSYTAEFGVHSSGLHFGPDSACLALGNIIFPEFYGRPITGVTGPVSETQSSSCATDVTYAVVGNVYWLSDECYTEENSSLCVDVCPDGFPTDLLGYPGCDRPELQQCSDGSFQEANEICPFESQQCWDYSSCLDYAQGGLQCEGATYFDFAYIDPSNFSASCVTIENDSPDHADNGGNQDGNPYNDPNSEEQPNIAEIDPFTLANAIDSELQNDFSNVERAVRESAHSADENTQDIVNSLNSIADSIDNIDINNSPIGPCDPSYPNYYQCLNNPLSNLPEHSQSSGTFATVNSAFIARVTNSPISQSFSGIAGMLSLENASCPVFSFDLPQPINQNIATNLHCELYDTIAPIIAAVMVVVWTFLGFRIFASA